MASVNDGLIWNKPGSEPGVFTNRVVSFSSTNLAAIVIGCRLRLFSKGDVRICDGGGCMHKSSLTYRLLNRLDFVCMVCINKEKPTSI